MNFAKNDFIKDLRTRKVGTLVKNFNNVVIPEIKSPDEKYS
jgi:hypothetical protein